MRPCMSLYVILTSTAVISLSVLLLIKRLSLREFNGLSYPDNLTSVCDTAVIVSNANCRPFPLFRVFSTFNFPRSVFSAHALCPGINAETAKIIIRRRRAEYTNKYLLVCKHLNFTDNAVPPVWQASDRHVYNHLCHRLSFHVYLSDGYTYMAAVSTN